MEKISRLKKCNVTPLPSLCSVVLVLTSVLLSPAMAQSPVTYPSLTEPMISGPLDLLLPEFLRSGYAARAWVRDSLPGRTDSLDDISRTDMIYLRSLYEAGGNHARALMTAMIAVFEHRTIPLKIGVKLPLTFESDESFAKRYAGLPDRIFADQPLGNDRDKLQHFFASAWLACSMDNDDLPEAIGWLIEFGERAFIKNSAVDPRDIRANRLGHLFAELLQSHPDALPGDILRAWNREYARRRGTGP